MRARHDFDPARSVRGAVRPISGPHPAVSRILAGALLVALVLGFAGCDLGAASHSSAATPPSATATTATEAPTTAAGTAARLPAFSGALGPAPAQCPASPALHSYSPTSFGGGFSGDITFQGGSPVWELGMGPVNKLGRDPSSGYFDTKVMWVVGPNFSQPVTLMANALQGGDKLWFDIFPSNSDSGPVTDQYAAQAVLTQTTVNRGTTDNSTGHWNIWGIGIIALSAGCYDFTASWTGGSWHTIVAFGS